MNPTEIVSQLILALTHGANLFPAFRGRFEEISASLRAFEGRTDLDNSHPIPNDLQNAFRMAAQELNRKELKFRRRSELGLSEPLRMPVIRAMQRCLHASLLDLASTAQGIGWEGFGVRLQDIEAPLLLNGLLGSQAEAARWGFCATDLMARVREARHTPEPVDDLSDSPPSAEELSGVTAGVEEFCCDLNLLIQWFPRFG